MNFCALIWGIINPLLAIPFTVCDYIRRRKPLVCSLLMATAMAYIAYCYKSRYVGDLERYVELLSLYKNKNLLNCFNGYYEGLYALDILFWICAKFANGRILVVFSTFILYFLTFYILLDYLRQYKETETRYIVEIVILVFMLLNFYSYISSLRSSLALSVGATVLYFEYVKEKKKWWNYALYILPSLFHLAGVIIVFVRLALLLKGKRRYVIWAVGGLVLALIGSGVLNGTLFIGGIFSEISKKMVDYSASGSMMNSAWFVAVRNSIITYIQKGICFVVMILSVWNLKKERDEYVIAYRMSQLGCCVSLLVIGMLFFPTTFYFRFFTALFPFVILTAFNGYCSKVKNLLLWGCAVGMMIIQIYVLKDNVGISAFLKHMLLGIFNTLFW